MTATLIISLVNVIIKFRKKHMKTSFELVDNINDTLYPER